MEAVLFFAGLCIIGAIGLAFIYSKKGQNWLNHLD